MSKKRECQCRACIYLRKDVGAFTVVNGHKFYTGGMIVCSVCGNKRCPHASDHRNACTGSNEAGQPGSIYA